MLTVSPSTTACIDTDTVTIDLEGRDPDLLDTVTLRVNPSPFIDTTFSQTSGNPATGRFTFRPTTAGSGAGTFGFTFIAQDDATPIRTTQRSVTITVVSATLPPDLGNSVRAVKTGGDNLSLGWGSVREASTYTLHRGTDKRVWPSPPFRPGVTGTTETLPDVPSPPDLYFYRVAGVNCAGVEGP